MRFLIFLALVLSSCSFFDQDSYEPAYLAIDEVTMDVKPGQGETTHQIKDVWVYLKGELLGVYPLPTKVPILVEGTEQVEIDVFPGIRNNGAIGQPFIYALIEKESLNLEMSPGETVTKNLAFRYVPNVKFDFIEDFENSNSLTYNPSDSARAEIKISSVDPISGDYSGYIALDADKKILYSGTNLEFDRNNNGGKDTYLEMDYKNSVPFIVGLEIRKNDKVNQVLKIVLNEREDWNKIYIDFTQELIDPEIQSYRLIIAADITGISQKSGEIYLDNLKLIHL